MVSRYGGALLQFVILAVITRALSQDDVGRFLVIMGVVQVTMYLAGFGLPDGLVRFTPALNAAGHADRAEALLRSGLVRSFLTLPLGAVLCTFGIFFYSGSWATAAAAGLWWASYGAIYVVGQIVVASGRASFGTAIYYSAGNIGQMVLAIPVILVARLSDLDAVLFVIALGTAVTAALSAVPAWRITTHGQTTLRVSHRDLREAWLQGVTIAASVVVNSCLYWLPVWVAALFLSSSDAALVGLASRLVTVVVALSGALRFSMRPALARDAALGDWAAIQKRASEVTLVAGIVAAAAIVLALTVGPVAISWAYGPQYRSVAATTAIMLVGALGASIPVDEVLKMSGQARGVLVVQTLALLLGAGALGLGSWRGGVTGLAVSYSAMTVLTALALNVYQWRANGVFLLPGTAWRRRADVLQRN